MGLVPPENAQTVTFNKDTETGLLKVPKEAHWICLEVSVFKRFLYHVKTPSNQLRHTINFLEYGNQEST